MSQSRDRITAEAVADTEYAAAVIEGARAHIIRPVRKQALSFYWPKAGKTVVFASVNHPGNQPNPFFRRVVDKWGTYL